MCSCGGGIEYEPDPRDDDWLIPICSNGCSTDGIYIAAFESEYRPVLLRADDVKFAEPRWLLKPYFQRGKGTLIQADNGVGKTAMMCALAACVSTGKDLLGLPVETPGNVLILSVEDDLPVLRGRIEASGGDLNRCHFIQGAAGLTFNSPQVETTIKHLGAKLVIFDPFQAFLGAGVQMDKSNQTRPQLAKLFEMASRTDCAVAIVAHIGKGSAMSSAVNRALGSVDIPAAMRSILHLTRNPDNPAQCTAVHIKSSNAPRGKSIAFTIGEHGGVRWDGFSEMTPDDLAQQSSGKQEPRPTVPYDEKPLVQLMRELVSRRPGGSFWSYSELKQIGTRLTGVAPFEDVFELRRTVFGPLGQQLLERDGISVVTGCKSHGDRGVRVTRIDIDPGDDKPLF